MVVSKVSVGEREWEDIVMKNTAPFKRRFLTLEQRKVFLEQDESMYWRRLKFLHELTA